MNSEDLKIIQNAVTESAAAARENAGYSGSWGDGGASAAEERLRVWLDGVNYATTGVTTVYGDLLKRERERFDPEYAEYLRLKDKFK
jgi:hypothetical protein